MAQNGVAVWFWGEVDGTRGFGKQQPMELGQHFLFRELGSGAKVLRNNDGPGWGATKAHYHNGVHNVLDQHLDRHNSSTIGVDVRASHKEPVPHRLESLPCTHL